MKTATEIVLDALEQMSDNEVPTEEGLFAMVRIATHAAMDLAPNDIVALRTVLAGVDEGMKEAQEGRDDV